ncbi:MAG: hypothetical protein WBC51_02700 [Vicinamibacterales bacterium]|jgi:hypothetical protein
MPDSSAYSEVEQILGQFFVAFGQGAGCVRVRRETVLAIRDRYIDVIEAESHTWEEEAVQVLERVRTVGRLAALIATERGSSSITREDFVQSTGRIESTSRTRWCGRVEG